MLSKSPAKQRDRKTKARYSKAYCNQRAEYPLTKEYTLNDKGLNSMI